MASSGPRWLTEPQTKEDLGPHPVTYREFRKAEGPHSLSQDFLLVPPEKQYCCGGRARSRLPAPASPVLTDPGSSSSCANS